MPPTPTPRSLAPVIVEDLDATAETWVGMGQFFWRSFTRNVDRVIKVNSTAQVIPSAKAIAAEVLRHQQIHRNEQNGTSVSRENWIHHIVEADIVKDAGLAYIEIDGGRDRKIICPVCRDYGRGIAAEASFNNNQRVKYLRKTIQSHLETYAHAKELTAMDKERTRNQRLCRVG